VDKHRGRRITAGLLWTRKRILKRFPETLAARPAEALQILSPPNGGPPRRRLGGKLRGPGNRDLCGSSGLGGRLSRSSRPPSNRQVSAMVGPREAPASHTCGGLAAVCAGCPEPARRRESFGLVRAESVRSWPNCRWPQISHAKKILKCSAGTACAGVAVGSRNSSTVTTDSAPEQSADGIAGKPRLATGFRCAPRSRRAASPSHRRLSEVRQAGPLQLILGGARFSVVIEALRCSESAPPDQTGARIRASGSRRTGARRRLVPLGRPAGCR
jgi:hypothetical protein